MNREKNKSTVIRSVKDTRRGGETKDGLITNRTLGVLDVSIYKGNNEPADTVGCSVRRMTHYLGQMNIRLLISSPNQ